jgi:lipopolysaccharide transport system permease protein
VNERPVIRIRAGSGSALHAMRELWDYRDLFSAFGTRDLRLRYRQTALGVAWVVLQPLVAAGIFSFVFGRIAGLPTEGQPYLLFSLAGLAAWNFFSTVLSRASSSLLANPQLISRVYFPRLILPLSVVPAALVDLLVTGAVFVALALSMGRAPSLGLLALPLVVILLGAIALGAGFAAAALAVRYRDVQYVIPVGIQLALYASPVAYSTSVVPTEWQAFYFSNPLVAPLELMRWSLLGTAAPPVGRVLYSLAAAWVLWMLGMWVFRRAERSFADDI